MSKIETHLSELGITLPQALAPVANYVSFRISGNLLIIAGQVCMGIDGKLAEQHKGKLGGTVSIEAGQEAARNCVINIFAQAKAALGDLDKISKCLRLGGFISSVPEFTSLPQVMNGASDLMVAILGEEGRHTRTTIGVPVLPFDCAVEVEALFEIKQ